MYLHDTGLEPDGLFPSADADGDGLSNGWEEASGLDPTSATLDDGAAGDPDHDGLTNAEERTASSHPRGTTARFFAEGAAGAFFDTRVSVANPGRHPAHVLVRLARDDGRTLTERLAIPPWSRATVEADAIVDLDGHAFSTIVEADTPVAIERTVSWGQGAYGAHADIGSPAQSPTWYLAEGSTAGQFELFYLLLNPQSVPVDARIVFLRPHGQPSIERTYALPATCRLTIRVSGVDPALAATDVSAAITATAPVVVERAMYRSRPGEPFSAGLSASAVPQLSTIWYLAEGVTGSFFDTFLLLANPNDAAAAVQVRYLGGGLDISKPYLLAPRSRLSVYLDDESFGSSGRALSAAAFSTIVESTNGVPVVAERTSWWPDAIWDEAHSSAGVAATASRWAVADAAAGIPGSATLPEHLQTYVLILNTSPHQGAVRIRLFLDDGLVLEGWAYLSGHDRVSVGLGDAQLRLARGHRFWALVESASDTPLQLVVERSTYWSVGGVLWAAGTSTPATALP